jgi:hypothetical protein
VRFKGKTQLTIMLMARHGRLIDLGTKSADRRPKRRKTLRTNTPSVRPKIHDEPFSSMASLDYFTAANAAS